MRGRADGAAAVAPDPTHGASGSDGRRFATARSASGIGEIPRIRGSTGEEIVGLISHQKFGCVGVAERNAAGRFEARDKRRIADGHIILAESRASGARPTGYFNAGFNGERDAAEKLRGFVARNRQFQAASTSQCGLGVYM